MMNGIRKGLQRVLLVFITAAMLVGMLGSNVMTEGYGTVDDDNLAVNFEMSDA